MTSSGRPAAAALVLVAVVCGLAGCTTTTYACSGSSCEVSLSGGGAESELADGLPVELVEADGTEASLVVDGSEVSCAEGATVGVAGVSVTCDTVGDDEVDLTVKYERQ